MYGFTYKILDVKKETVTSKSVSYRNFKKLNESEFSSDLNTININSHNVNTFVNEFESEIENVLNKHAPIQEKTIIQRAPKPWFNENLQQLKQKVRKSERTWRLYGKTDPYESYKAIRKEYNLEIKRQKRNTLSEKIENAKGDCKTLYRLVMELTGTKSENPLPQGKSSDTLAEQFADFFMEKISKIRQSLSELQDFKPQVKDVQNFEEFTELTQVEVKRLISELNTTSSELDILPTRILKSYVDPLLPNITNLVNLLLKQGVFPTKYKQAVVRPLLKKVGLELELSNYRPVSNLSFLSKVIEKAVLYRLNKHVNQNNLLPKNQSAYRKYHSCESALLRLVNDLLNSMEKQEVAVLISIDLSAAFDTVDHNILIDVLQAQYGVSETALQWMDSYLRPRTCKINIGNSFHQNVILNVVYHRAVALVPGSTSLMLELFLIPFRNPY